MPDRQKSLTAARAFRFVLILGIANGFADLTYEGARSVTGQFLGYLGASAAVIGFTAGLGELLGYSLRSLSGYLGDKTGRYWLVTIIGYSVNMLAVPALALAGNWPLAAGLIELSEQDALSANHLLTPCYHSPATNLAAVGSLA